MTTKIRMFNRLMRREPPGRFSMKIFAAALLLTVLVLGSLGWCLWDSYQGLKTFQTREFRLQELIGEVTHGDEVLTMSARMAAATGNPQWEERYHQHEPALDAAIQEILNIAPETYETEGAAQTDEANRKLVEMELQSFELVRQGERNKAAELLFSEEYDKQKRIYKEGMDKSFASLKARMLRTFESQRQRLFYAESAVMGAVPVVVLAWLYAIRALSVYLSAQVRKEGSLKRAHDELERHVEKRTVDLKETSERLEREIGDRQRAEMALRESEERAKAILDNSPAVVYVKDLEGRYLLINRRFEELFHVSLEELRGKTDYALFPKEMADAFRANDTRVLAKDEPIEFEEVARHDDSNHIYISLKFALHDDSGAPYAVCGISTDITERKRAELQIKKAKEAAEAANRAKSVFLANMSHEIRTPLTAVLGAAELLRATSDDLAGRFEQRDVILRNGRYLLSLLNDLLDVARLEAGKLEVHPIDCSLLEIMMDAVAATGRQQIRQEVEFKVLYDGPIPAQIHTDPTRLKQAIINLVNNALKFTERGHVYVRIRADRSRAEPRLSVAVEDTGAGIPPEDLERVFETFTQLDATSAITSKGVGLGLPLAKWIVEQLGGVLHVTSVVGSGSTFTLELPIGIKDVQWITPSEVSILAPRIAKTREHRAQVRLKGRILLAEDFGDTRRLIQGALAASGAEVTAVASGREAVAAAMHQTYDLIIMDIRMPEMDGRQAAAELRRRGCKTPMIALTASTELSERNRILEAGFDDFWPKPISLEHLIEAVAAYLETAPPEQPVVSVRTAPSTSGLANSPRMAAARADFADSLKLRVDRIQEAVKNGELGHAREELHKLVGAAGIHGFMSLSHTAARLLAMAKNGALTQSVPELKVLEESVVAITASLGEG